MPTLTDDEFRLFYIALDRYAHYLRRSYKDHIKRFGDNWYAKERVIEMEKVKEVLTKYEDSYLHTSKP